MTSIDCKKHFNLQHDLKFLQMTKKGQQQFLIADLFISLRN